MKVSVGKLVGVGAAGVALMFLVVAVGGYLWLDRFLRSEDCRKILGQLIGQEMGLTGSFQPLVWSGFGVFSGGYQGAREGNGPIAGAEFDRIRAELRVASFFRGVWDIPEIRIERLEMDLTPPPRRQDGTLAEPPPPMALDIKPSPFLALLPSRVSIGRIVCPDATLIWPSDTGGVSALRGATVIAEPDGPSWTFRVEGGRLKAPGFPEMAVESGMVRLNTGDFLFLESRLREANGGNAEVRGKVELSGEKRLDLKVSFRDVNVEPFLDEDWRKRLTGRAEGELRVEGTTGALGSLRIRGPVRLRDARLEALPILNTVALLTQTQEFRTLRFNRAEGTVDWSPAELNVSDLNVESELLLRLMGQIQTRGEQLSGGLMVGTTPKTLRMIPGATEKVFTTARDGYVWAPVQVSGTVDAPKEDLTPRLQQAAVGTVIEAVPETIRERVREGAGGLLDKIFKNF